MNELFLINAAMEDIGVGTAGLVALLGYLVVFIGLISLMVVIMIVGKIMVGKQASAKAAAPKQAAPAVAPAPAAAKPAAPEAPGTAGELKLYGTPDRDAALIMAIVAHKMGKPLNTLRFKSIKEVQ